MNRLLSHDFKERQDFVKPVFRAANHECQRAARGSANAARHGRVERKKTCCNALIRHRARAFHVHGGAIEQRRTLVHHRDHLIRDRAQNRTVWQHGDEHVDTACGLCRAGRNAHALSAGAGNVKTFNAMARSGEIGGHWAAHVA